MHHLNYFYFLVSGLHANPRDITDTWYPVSIILPKIRSLSLSSTEQSKAVLLHPTTYSSHSFYTRGLICKHNVWTFREHPVYIHSKSSKSKSTSLLFIPFTFIDIAIAARWGLSDTEAMCVARVLARWNLTGLCSGGPCHTITPISYCGN